MATVELGGKSLEIDEDGFIQDPELWDDAVAKSLAETEGVSDMTEAVPHGLALAAGAVKSKHLVEVPTPSLSPAGLSRLMPPPTQR